MISLEQIIVGVQLELTAAHQLPSTLASVRLSGACIDSREATLDCLYVALPSERGDGHAFIAAAAARGARAALVQRGRVADHGSLGLDRPCVDIDPEQGIWPTHAPADAVFLISVDEPLAALQRLALRQRQRFDLVLVAVLGTVGKAATQEVLAAMLSPTLRTYKAPRGTGTLRSLPVAILGLSTQQQNALLELRVDAQEDAQLLYAMAQPQIVIVTQIGPLHLEPHASLEAVWQAQHAFVQQLPADAWLILNRDDERVQRLAEQAVPQVFTYGLDPSADLWANNIESRGLDGITFDVHYRQQTSHVKLPLIGLHSVHTALAAAAVGLVQGLDWDSLIEGLRTSAQLRLLSYPMIGGATLIEDTYSASLMSSIAALTLLSELSGGHCAIFGALDAELQEESYRAVGARAADVLDHVFVLGEPARWIGLEALERGMAVDHVHFSASADELLAQLKATVGPDDYVLIKGVRSALLRSVVERVQTSDQEGRA